MWLIDELLGFSKTEDITVARRTHRRLEAICMHPARDDVIHAANLPVLVAARDTMREALGFPESLSKAIGQKSIDEEIYVTENDGVPLFAIRPSYDGQLDE